MLRQAAIPAEEPAQPGAQARCASRILAELAAPVWRMTVAPSAGVMEPNAARTLLVLTSSGDDDNSTFTDHRSED